MSTVTATRTAEAVALAPAPRPAHVRVSFTQAVYVIWLRDLIRFYRDRARLIGALAQPVLFLVVFGVGLSSALGGGRIFPPGLTYIQFMFPGVVCMTVLMTSIFSAMSIVWDREFGFLREILVAPIERSAVAVGKALGGATQAMVGGVLMLIFAPIVGVRLTVLGVLELIPLLFLFAFTLTALGIAIASRMKSMQGFQVVMNFLMMPMLFLSGALFPLAGLPDWMTVITRFDPVTYAVSPVRTALFSNAGLSPAVLDRIGAEVSIGGYTLPLILDVGIVVAVGATVLGFAIRALQARD
ncbi:MAG TPA: ABC transporter permease [Candidatus Binatia bacterium]|nr:ABC transporter permease [Candidatus Binatia bacterium]